MRDAGDVPVHPVKDPEETTIQHECLPTEKDHQRVMEHPRQILQGYELSNLRQYWNQHRMGSSLTAQLWFPYHTQGTLPGGRAPAVRVGKDRTSLGDECDLHLMLFTYFTYSLIINAPWLQNKYLPTQNHTTPTSTPSLRRVHPLSYESGNTIWSRSRSSLSWNNAILDSAVSIPKVPTSKEWWRRNRRKGGVTRPIVLIGRTVVVVCVTNHTWD